MANLAAVLDLHTRKIVGWSMRETLHAEIALEARDMAIWTWQSGGNAPRRG